MRQILTCFLLAGTLIIGCSDDLSMNAPLAESDESALAKGSKSCAVRINNTVDKLLECVTVDNVRVHQAALQSIADANGGTRASGTPGYDRSAEYVAERLNAVGYDVTVQNFQYQAFISLTPALLQQVAPPPAGPIANTILSYSGSGDVTASVSTLSVPTGCNAADYAGFPAGNIALIVRGSCTFNIKATNAFGAGASGVVIYNNIPGAVNGTLTSGFTLDIPVTSVTLSVGQQLAATSGLVLRLKTDTFRGLATSSNVLAESRYGDATNVVMVGGHLDGVPEGPGIQDNGSGAGAILETAIQMSKVRPRNKVRFAFWGAGEQGFAGSDYYLSSLTSGQLDDIALYLDFEMIGSPNYVFFVLDGDDSDNVGQGPGPQGSAQVEQLLATYYQQRGHPFKGVDLSIRSDYSGFSTLGIPVGGLFGGADGIKSAEEVAIWGGTAGDAYDPCYHLACDTFDNISLHALDVNSDAVANATLSFAMNTEIVNWVRGKGNFKSPPGESAHAL